jgi:hypothetical protein
MDDTAESLTDDQFTALRATARRYTVVILTPGPNRMMPGADAIIYRHGMRNAALHLDGRMPVVCPSVDDTPFRGVAILDATVEQATSIMDGDPAIQAEVLAYELHPVRSFPGSTLPG